MLTALATDVAQQSADMDASTAELRLRLGNQLGLALFYDMGDVNAEPSFRFNEPNPSLGFGARYLTPVGTIRGDFGFRLGSSNDDDEKGTLFGHPGALHITLGEAF